MVPLPEVHDVSSGKADAECSTIAGEGAFRCSDGRVGGPALARSRARCTRPQCNEHQRTYWDAWYVVHTHSSTVIAATSSCSATPTGREQRGHRPGRAWYKDPRGLDGARDARHPSGRRSLLWIALCQCAVNSGSDQRGSRRIRRSGEQTGAFMRAGKLAGLEESSRTK